MQSKLIIALLLVVAVLPLTAKLSSDDTVCVILPYSSAFGEIATEQQHAIDLALQELGKPCNVIYLDSGSDAAGARDAFGNVLNLKTKPRAIISCASWVATELHPLAAQHGIFHIVIGSAGIERSVPRHTVRFTLDASQEEQQLAAYLSHFPRIAVLCMNNAYGNTWAGIIQRNFGERVVASLAYDPMKNDFADELRQIEQAQPDALVLLSAGNAARIARQARELGIQAQLVGTRPIERPELQDEAEFTQGLVYTYPSFNPKHPFLAAYRQAWGTEATIFGVEAYDAMTSLVQAIQGTAGTPEALFDWYAGRTWHGALGEVTFDEQGDAHYPYMYKTVSNGRFVVAEFQFSLLLEEARQQLQNTFDQMLSDTRVAAQAIGGSPLDGQQTTDALQALYETTPHAYDCVAVNADGVIVNVWPAQMQDVLGADISAQPQIVELHATQQPVVSQAIQAVEGFLAFDLEYPVFAADGTFAGSVSVLTEPDFFGNVIAGNVSNFPVEMWVMQPDGMIVYDLNPEEIGLNLFTAPLYAGFPSLLQVGRRMAQEPMGSGSYTFYDKKLKDEVKKNIIWSTVELREAEFRLALAWVPSQL